MGASEEQGVDVGVAHGRQQTLGEDVHVLAGGLSALDELDETGARGALELYGRTGRGHRALVGTRRNRPDGRDHAHPSFASGCEQGTHAGVDDAHDRNVVLEAQSLERRRRRVVAGDHDHLHVVAIDEQLGDLAGEFAHLFERSRPVWIAARVTEVDEILVGQQVDEGPGDGQAPEPAVEHPDGPVVHPLPRRPL